MKPSVLVAGFFPPPITGQGLATQRLSELLSEAYEVHTVNLREEEEQLDLRLAGRLLKKISTYRKAGQRLSETIRAHPDATVLWTSISPEPMGHFRDLYNFVPGFLPDQRVFGVVHWGRFAHLFKSPFTTSTAPKIINRLAGLVFLNQDRADQCARWVPAEKRSVIPNTLDTPVLCSAKEVEQKHLQYTGDRPLRLLFLSHMIREKGYMDVLEAIHLLQEQRITVQATFAGQWLAEKDRKSFQDRLDAWRLNASVSHLGPVTDRATIKKLHLSSDVFLLPSYLIEGQPLAILEALNAGSPVITCNVGGMVGMIETGVEGFLIKPRAPLAIADAIQKLIPADIWKAASQAARSRYLSDYSSASVLKQWQVLIG